MLKKQIPTLLGLAVLVVGLIIGAILFSNGTGIFLPRATPETTPKSIRISNVSDQGFTVSFMTDEATSGFVRYGTDPKKLTQIGDQRDQLTGSVGEYTLHQISVLRGLEPDTTYYYVLGTGKGALFDDNGVPFTLKTARQAGTQPKALTVFGSAVTASGAPATGAIVFVTPPNAGTLSSLVTNTGSWAVSLSNARTKDGSNYAPVAVGDDLSIQVMAVDPADNTQVTTKVEAESAIALELGKNGGLANTATPEAVTKNVATSEPQAATSASRELVTISSQSAVAKQSLNGLVDSAQASNSAATPLTIPTSTVSATPTPAPTPEVKSFDLNAAPTEVVTVTTGQPTITGSVEPNVVVSIEIHSETAISTQVTTDANGDFVLDLTQYEQTLEPGEHTITYSYVDPNSGETVTKTKTFTVAPRVTLAAASTPTPTPRSTASLSPTPYGSSNPYPIGTSSATGKTSSTSAKLATRSAKVGTASGMPTSGSIGTTLLLIGGGLFFLVSGLWSWWISRELTEEYSE